MGADCLRMRGDELGPVRWGRSLQECGPARAGGGGPGRRRCRSRGRPTWGLRVQATGPASSCRTGKGTQLAQNGLWGVEGEWALCVWLALLLGSAPASALGQFWPGCPRTRPQRGTRGRVTSSPCALLGGGGRRATRRWHRGAGVRVAWPLAVATPAALLPLTEEPLRRGKQACLQKSAVPCVGWAAGEQTGGPGCGGACRRSR